jgi:hypothetical protein
MKKTVLFAIIALTTFCCTPYAAADDSAKSEKTPGVGYVLLRGVSNIGLGILEVPQTMVYQCAEIPVLGLVTGLACGAVTFVWREIAGITDVLSLGFAGHGLYFAGMTDFPWNEPWLPREYQ